VLKSVTGERLVKTEDFACAVVTVIFGVCNSASLKTRVVGVRWPTAWEFVRELKFQSLGVIAVRSW
jgi:hypothetical protein